MADTVHAADATADFSQYSIVYIVPVKGSPFTFSPTTNQYPGQGIRADGKELRHFVTVGSDMYYWGYKLLNHETAHIFGLPDLYDYSANPSSHRFVGGWDIMGLISGAAPGYLAWERWLFGWIGNAQVDCLNTTHDKTVTLTPVEVKGGKKLVVFRTGPQQVIAAEYRNGTAEDDAACSTGLLVYRIDNNVASGSGPVRVADARPHTTPTASACGHGHGLDDAAYGLRTGPFHAGNGLTLTVTRKTAAALTVRITYPRSQRGARRGGR